MEFVDSTWFFPVRVFHFKISVSCTPTGVPCTRYSRTGLWGFGGVTTDTTFQLSTLRPSWPNWIVVQGVQWHCLMRYRSHSALTHLLSCCIGSSFASPCFDISSLVTWESILLHFMTCPFGLAALLAHLVEMRLDTLVEFWCLPRISGNNVLIIIVRHRTYKHRNSIRWIPCGGLLKYDISAYSNFSGSGVITLIPIQLMWIAD